MNVYRTPPDPLPSLRSLDTLPGTRLMWPPGKGAEDDLNREQLARSRAMSAPCPALPPGANPRALGCPPHVPPPPKKGPSFAPANVPE